MTDANFVGSNLTPSESASTEADLRKPQLSKEELKELVRRMRHSMIEKYKRRIGHTNPWLRSSMVIAYGAGVDDCLKAFGELAEQAAGGVK